MEEKEERLARAISAGSRRAILRLLSNRELTVKEISARINISVSLASRHLQLLYDLGFLSVRKESIYKYYSIRIKEINELLDVYDKVLRRYER
ncbi:winged helix-turn-helix transcriptional regulator [Candidatus Woesearchaeota archaeon]|nr:winged helix-turn-helix transcriptional regulator [Candidatus Woesearchaeota archaeon]